MNLKQTWIDFSNTLSKVARSLIWLAVKLYQVGLSSQTGPCCRFHPTCSNYAEETLRTHGLWTAIFLIIKRLIKCRPGGPMGYDPVPLTLNKGAE